MGTHVIKTFKGNGVEAKVSRLEAIYKLLKDKSVPNTDSLVTAKGNFLAWNPFLTKSREGTMGMPYLCAGCARCMLFPQSLY